MVIRIAAYKYVEQAPALGPLHILEDVREFEYRKTKAGYLNHIACFHLDDLLQRYDELVITKVKKD